MSRCFTCISSWAITASTSSRRHRREQAGGGADHRVASGRDRWRTRWAGRSARSRRAASAGRPAGRGRRDHAVELRVLGFGDDAVRRPTRSASLSLNQYEPPTITSAIARPMVSEPALPPPRRPATATMRPPSPASRTPVFMVLVNMAPSVWGWLCGDGWVGMAGWGIGGVDGFWTKRSQKSNRSDRNDGHDGIRAIDRARRVVASTDGRRVRAVQHGGVPSEAG